MDEGWAVVAEHLMPAGWVPIDAGGQELLYFEAVLKAEGMDVVFSPYRPGESGGFTDACGQTLRLLVRESDLERARELVAAARAGEQEPET